VEKVRRNYILNKVLGSFWKGSENTGKRENFLAVVSSSDLEEL
jgi:hypothetical protein